MNILETQVTDLNYLAESPISLSGMNGPRQSSSAESPANTGESGKKRKADDANEHNNSGNGHTRAKRNRYISIAWYVLISSATAAQREEQVHLSHTG